MQYSPKLKKAAEEMKKVLKKYDIAGLIILHTPGHGEFVLEIGPSYSCAKVEHSPGGTVIRYRAKATDYNGNVAKRDQMLNDTVNMMDTLTEITSRQAVVLIDQMEQMQKVLDIERGPSGFTSDDAQNN